MDICSGHGLSKKEFFGCALFGAHLFLYLSQKKVVNESFMREVESMIFYKVEADVELEKKFRI